MIDKSTEHMYNIMLSIFLGCVVVVIFDSFFDKPFVSYKIINKPKPSEQMEQ